MKMKLLILLGLIALASAKTFFGDQVLTLYPKNDAQAKVIRHLNDDEELVDFWSPGYPNQVRAGHSVDIRIPSPSVEFFKVLMRRNRIDFEVKMSDVQEMMDNQLKGRSSIRGIFDESYDYYSYHNYNEVANWVDDITAKHSIATKMSLGTSFEGRDIQMIKISATNKDNPAMLVDCGFHAREWISPAFCQCYTRNLLEGYGSDATITSILDQLTIYIVPVVNVDGYSYTWTDDRMWRKTRSKRNGIACIGVDPNRNCDAGFGGEGSSDKACSDIYHGPQAESEVEVKALADFIRLNIDNIKNYVTIHAYSQLILYPYSYTYDEAKNIDQLNDYAKLAEEAVFKPYSTRYTYGPGAVTIYPAAGGSDDFAYDAGVPLSYTLELRDKGRYGFLLPEDQISPVCVETTALMAVMANAAIDVFNAE